MKIFARVTGVLAAIAVFAVYAALTAGCQAPMVSEAADNETGGISFSMLVTEGSNKAVLYRVDKDGTISFAGGRDAHEQEFSWSGTLTEEEAARLADLFAAVDWNKPAGDSNEASTNRKFNVRINAPQHRRVTVNTASTALRELETFLAEVSMRRNEAIFHALPQPTVDQPGNQP